jgi:hypothetical protein
MLSSWTRWQSAGFSCTGSAVARVDAAGQGDHGCGNKEGAESGGNDNIYDDLPLHANLAVMWHRRDWFTPGRLLPSHVQGWRPEGGARVTCVHDVRGWCVARGNVRVLRHRSQCATDYYRKHHACAPARRPPRLMITRITSR